MDSAGAKLVHVVSETKTDAVGGKLANIRERASRELPSILVE